MRQRFVIGEFTRPRRATASRIDTPRSRLFYLAIVVAGVAFMVGRSSVPAQERQRVNPPAGPSDHGSTPVPAVPLPARFVAGPAFAERAGQRSPAAPLVRQDQDQDSEVLAIRTQRAAAAVGVLHDRVAEALRDEPNAPPVEVANRLLPFVNGWVEATVRAAPELTPALAQKMEQSACSAETSDAELIVQMRVTMGIPELGTTKGFDCFFAHHTTEDEVMWSGLNAWQATGLPMSDAIADVRRRATEPRTKLALTDPEQLAKLAPTLRTPTPPNDPPPPGAQ